MASRGKLLQASPTTEVGVNFYQLGSMNRHHLQAYLLLDSLQRWAWQPNTTHCPHSLGTHTSCHCHRIWKLLSPSWGSLPLPRGLQAGAACTPMAHESSPLSSAQQLGTGYRPCPLPHLPGRTCRAYPDRYTTYQGDNSLHTLRKEKATTQTKSSPHTKTKQSKSKPSQATQGCLCIWIALQDYSR